MKRLLLSLLLLLTFSGCAEAKRRDLRGETVPYAVTGSDDYRVIWFRIPKNASRSIGAVLDSAMGDHLNINPDALGLVSYNSEKYCDYFKFIFVRNPWERTVSCYFNQVLPSTHHPCRNMKFEAFVEWISQQDLDHCDNHIQRQSSFIPPGIELDFVGRMETFEEDLTTLMNHLGLPSDQIPHKNASKHDHYSHYYNDHTRELIRKIYEEDIARFGYAFETEGRQ